MENQKRHQEGHICENNHAVTDITPLDTKDNDTRTPTGAHVSDNDSIVYSSFVHPPTKSEGDFVSDNSDGGLPDFPSPASNIPSLSQPSPPNTSHGGDIYREGYQAEHKTKYQRKQWPEAVW